jgi:YfiH family protein
VKYADCVPILLATPDGRAVAAVHAGWRGVVAGVVHAAVAHLTRRADPSQLLAAIGPSISLDNFEVGPEVLTAFERLFGPHAPNRRHDNGKGHVDLRRSVRLQLLAARLTPDHIDETDRCTHCDAQEFYSHRREGPATGRMAALITPNPRARRSF